MLAVGSNIDSTDCSIIRRPIAVAYHMADFAYSIGELSLSPRLKFATVHRNHSKTEHRKPDSQLGLRLNKVQLQVLSYKIMRCFNHTSKWMGQIIH